MRTLFLPCYFDGLSTRSGSARIRCHWVAKHWEGAEVYDKTQPLAGWDLYVFQKLYLTEEPIGWIKAVARWRAQGKCRLAFDLCDPDFLGEEHKRRMLKVLPLFDFAVVTTGPLEDWMKQWLPTYRIPDRLDIEEVQAIGRHECRDVEMPLLVWAGYDYNLDALDELMPEIRSLGCPPVTLLAFEEPVPFEEFWSAVLQAGDVLLNPRPQDTRHRFKSDNKTLVARALGMPVAQNGGQLRRLMDPAYRRMVATIDRELVEEHWPVRLSVEDWKAAAAHFEQEQIK